MASPLRRLGLPCYLLFYSCSWEVPSCHRYLAIAYPLSQDGRRLTYGWMGSELMIFSGTWVHSRGVLF